MRVHYNANYEGYKTSDATEQHIAAALTKLGHEVVDGNGDIYLFHKGLDHKQLLKDLRETRGLKVCWYFDKIWLARKKWINEILPKVELFCLTDGSWAKEHPDDKYRIVRQGCNPLVGVKKSYNAKIVFTGQVYGERSAFVAHLYEQFGDDFGISNDSFNQDLADLCASVPILVAPQWPSDDHYWSSRVYLTMGSGGFMIHPRLKDLEKEYVDGKEIVFYDNLQDLTLKIRYYLSHPEEREKIRLAGQKKTVENYTYEHRVKELLNHVLPLTRN